MKSSMRGFSLIEMMIVLVIIAVILTFALPDRSAPVAKTYVRQSINLVEDYKPIIKQYYLASGGSFPKDNEAIGLPKPELIIGKYFTEVTLEDGAIHILLGNKITEKLQNKTVTVRPVFVEDSPLSPISWICGYDETPEGMTAAGTNLTNAERRFLPLDCI